MFQLLIKVRNLFEHETRLHLNRKPRTTFGVVDPRAGLPVKTIVAVSSAPEAVGGDSIFDSDLQTTFVPAIELHMSSRKPSHPGLADH